MDDALHQALHDAHRGKQLDIFTDFHRLNHIGSPVFNAWDNIVPLLGMLFASLMLMVFQGMALGILAMGLSVLAHFVLVRHWIEHRLHMRTLAMMFHSPYNWDVLWGIGGIAMVLREAATPCVAPQDDWRRYAKQVQKRLTALAQPKVPVPVAAEGG